MQQAITKDELAALYESQWPALVRTATWLLHDQSLAEEVVQDGFIRLAEHWTRLRDPQAAPAWLRTTVVNLSRGRLRRRSLGRRRQEQASTNHARRFGTTDQSADLLGDGLADGALGAAIRALPLRQRECVVLRFVHDLTVPELAATLGISSGSVKTHLHRALKTLEEAVPSPTEEAGHD